MASGRGDNGGGLAPACDELAAACDELAAPSAYPFWHSSLSAKSRVSLALASAIGSESLKSGEW